MAKEKLVKNITSRDEDFARGTQTLYVKQIFVIIQA